MIDKREWAGERDDSLQVCEPPTLSTSSILQIIVVDYHPYDFGTRLCVSPVDLFGNPRTWERASDYCIDTKPFILSSTHLIRFGCFVVGLREESESLRMVKIHSSRAGL